MPAKPKSKPLKSKPAKPVPAPASPAVGRFDDAHLRELAALLETHGLSELTLELPHGKVRLRRGGVAPSAPVSAPPGPVAAAPVADAAPSAKPAPSGVEVTSPFVGTFYRSPGPEAPAFVEIGQRVRKGQVLCIVEAMKLMNEIEAELDGTVVACQVDDAHPVEYGQVLFTITPA